MKASPALVILAAGASRRLGEPKALALIHGRSVLAQLLDAGRGMDEVPPLVIGGAHSAELRTALPAGAELLHNPDWRAGRTGGVALAQAERPGHDLCLSPADVPGVRRTSFERLVEAWQRAGSPPRGWLAPRHGERHGHPVIVGRELLERLREIQPDSPLRDLRALADPLLELEVDDPGVLNDLDTPSDLARLRAAPPVE